MRNEGQDTLTTLIPNLVEQAAQTDPVEHIRCLWEDLGDEIQNVHDFSKELQEATNNVTQELLADKNVETLTTNEIRQIVTRLETEQLPNLASATIDSVYFAETIGFLVRERLLQQMPSGSAREYLTIFHLAKTSIDIEPRQSPLFRTAFPTLNQERNSCIVHTEIAGVLATYGMDNPQEFRQVFTDLLDTQATKAQKYEERLPKNAYGRFEEYASALLSGIQAEIIAHHMLDEVINDKSYRETLTSALSRKGLVIRDLAVSRTLPRIDEAGIGDLVITGSTYHKERLVADGSLVFVDVKAAKSADLRRRGTVTGASDLTVATEVIYKDDRGNISYDPSDETSKPLGERSREFVRKYGVPIMGLRIPGTIFNSETLAVPLDLEVVQTLIKSDKSDRIFRPYVEYAIRTCLLNTSRKELGE